MARTVAIIPAPPERVWDVLADPQSYGSWVVGSDTIRDADPNWPEPGSMIHHRVGVGPIKIDDNTEVTESDPARRLRMHARFRPLGTAVVDLELQPDARGTRVTMTEEPGDWLSRVFHNPLTDRILAKRNAESLRRLAELAARPAEAGAGSRTLG